MGFAFVNMLPFLAVRAGAPGVLIPAIRRHKGADSLDDTTYLSVADWNSLVNAAGTSSWVTVAASILSWFTSLTTSQQTALDTAMQGCNTMSGSTSLGSGMQIEPSPHVSADAPTTYAPQVRKKDSTTDETVSMTVPGWNSCVADAGTTAWPTTAANNMGAFFTSMTTAQQTATENSFKAAKAL